MEYKSVVCVAECMNVSVRAVQKWCKEGKIEGAKKMGRDWLIPESFCASDVILDIEETSDDVPLPLLNCIFKSGEALETINSIEDETKRNMALCEYHYYRGEFVKSADISQLYLNDKKSAYRFTANLISAYSNLAEKHIHITEFSFNLLKQLVESGLRKSDNSKDRALAVLAEAKVSTQFQYPIEKIPEINSDINNLPEGLKIFGCYLMAYRAYLQKDYSRSLGIADTALALFPDVYPVATAYLYIISAVALMNLLKKDEAKERIKAAWEIAGKDGFIVPFVEHYGVLQGTIEVYFKRDYAELYKKIANATKRFNDGWFKIHNRKTGETVADNLTNTEFTVAMLFSRGWRIKEIASYMELSERTIKNYLQVVYEKLGINGKRELEKYLIK